MPKRTASFTTTELRRAIRAAKAEGFERVELETTGGLRVICEKRHRLEPLESTEGVLE